MADTIQSNEPRPEATVDQQSVRVNDATNDTLSSHSALNASQTGDNCHQQLTSNSQAVPKSQEVEKKADSRSHKESGSTVPTTNNGTTRGEERRNSRDSFRLSSHSSRKKHNHSPEHKHRNRKKSPTSHSRSRRRSGSPVQTDTNHSSKSVTKHSPASTAEMRTRIVLQIYEEVLQNGSVVDSKVRETEFITSGGTVPWPLVAPILQSVSAEKDKLDIMKRSNHSPPKRSSASSQEKGKVSLMRKTEALGHKRSGHKNQSTGSTGKKVKIEIDRVSDDREEEDSRIDVASTLLSLQTESPVKKVIERQENFNELIFKPLKEGNTVMAKWLDKNFYAGILASNLGDGRWHVHFDDGGKKAVNESDIISVPYLTIGQVVMATFSDGSLCLKGMVKQPFYEKDRLFYLVEYNDSSKLVTEKFSRRDIFLTSELAASLLSKQSKGSDKLTKFADVDLNNIIPKRSRLSAQNKNLDGSTDGDSETESIPPTVRQTSSSAAKNRKHVPSKPAVTSSQTPVKPVAKSSSQTQSAIPSKPVPEPASEPETETVAEKPDDEPPVAPVTESPEDQLGPVLEEGSTLFSGMSFLLTTADAGNSSDSTSDSLGRQTIPFDIPHLIRQIESGGGCVHQTLENAQESNSSKEIILLACTYLRTVKYMQCLAAGIPCVRHVWLIECCREKRLLDRENFLLPSGYSIISNSLITDRSVFSRSCTLFNGVRFMLVSKNPRHAESWTSVLTAAKAIVVDDFPSSSGTATRKASNSVDVVISDSTCPSHVMKKAQQMRIPVVSSEYVVQCLINGTRLPYDAHDKFLIGSSFPANSTSQ